MTTSTAAPGSTRSRSVRAARKASSDAFHPSATWVMGAGFQVAGITIVGTPANMSASVMWRRRRSEEHTSELQSLMRISYAVFCLKKKNKKTYKTQNRTNTLIYYRYETRTT